MKRVMNSRRRRCQRTSSRLGSVPAAFALSCTGATEAIKLMVSFPWQELLLQQRTPNRGERKHRICSARALQGSVAEVSVDPIAHSQAEPIGGKRVVIQPDGPVLIFEIRLDRHLAAQLMIDRGAEGQVGEGAVSIFEGEGHLAVADQRLAVELRALTELPDGDARP